MYNIKWIVNTQELDYLDTLNRMEQQVTNMSITPDMSGEIWLLEHPPMYTAGLSAKSTDLLQKNYLPVYQTNRGGQYTYHGTGQRIVYFMLDLEQYFAPELCDIRLFVRLIEEWLIQTLAQLNIKGERRKDRVGIWVIDSKTQEEKKIAAIGLRLKKRIVYHGIALNVCPNLEHYQGIVPCGIKEFGVTSIQEQTNIIYDMHIIDQFLYQCFLKTFVSIKTELYPSILTKG